MTDSLRTRTRARTTARTSVPGHRVGLVAALTSSLLLSACANIGTLSEADLASCQMPAASADPNPPELPERTAKELPAPKSITGPTTAYTHTDQITPITNVAQEFQTLPTTVASSDGPQQTVTDTTRILALNQNGGLAAAVYALGFGCNLVGRDIATAFSGLEELPLVVNNGTELNAESILALQPTVVITDTSIGPYDVQLQLREAGIPVVFVPIVYTGGVQAVGSQIRQVADALGVSELGRELAERTDKEITQTIQGIARMAPDDPADRPRIVFLYVRGKSIYYWFGEGSGADSLIQSIAANDVAAEVGFTGMAPTNAEALVKAAPDVIIAMTLGVASAGGLDQMLQLPGIAQTPAGRNRRVVDMSDYEVMSFGPQTAQVLAALATAVYAPEEAYQPEEAPPMITKRLNEIGQEQSE